MKSNKMKIITSDLSGTLNLIESNNAGLIRMKEDYKNSFLKQVQLLCHLFYKNSSRVENFNRYMLFNLGTTEDEIPSKLKSEIVLGRDPTYLDYLCHIMIGCLVLKKELTCNIGSEKEETVDILPVIQKTGEMLGLKVLFSTKDKICNGKPYKDRYASFKKM